MQIGRENSKLFTLRSRLHRLRSRSGRDAASLVMGTRASAASAGWRGDARAPARFVVLIRARICEDAGGTPTIPRIRLLERALSRALFPLRTPIFRAPVRRPSSKSIPIYIYSLRLELDFGAKRVCYAYS